MPEISQFYGIRITMNYSEHNPPHFHAAYGDYEALVGIKAPGVLEGMLPGRQIRLVLAWCEIHKDELDLNWELAREKKPLNKIEPLR